MDTSYKYTTLAEWVHGRNGILSAEGMHHDIAFSTPPEFHGQSGKWTPEHFIVASLATCFVATFVAATEISKLEILDLAVNVTGVLEKPEGYLRFTKFIIAPKVTIANEADHDRAMRLLEKAERGCLIARSLNGKMELQPEILVAAAVA